MLDENRSSAEISRIIERLSDMHNVKQPRELPGVLQAEYQLQPLLHCIASGQRGGAAWEKYLTLVYMPEFAKVLVKFIADFEFEDAAITTSDSKIFDKYVKMGERLKYLTERDKGIYSIRAAYILQLHYGLGKFYIRDGRAKESRGLYKQAEESYLRARDSFVEAAKFLFDQKPLSEGTLAPVVVPEDPKSVYMFFVGLNLGRAYSYLSKFRMEKKSEEITRRYETAGRIFDETKKFIQAMEESIAVRETLDDAQIKSAAVCAYYCAGKAREDLWDYEARAKGGRGRAELLKMAIEDFSKAEEISRTVKETKHTAAAEEGENWMEYIEQGTSAAPEYFPGFKWKEPSEEEEAEAPADLEIRPITDLTSLELQLNDASARIKADDFGGAMAILSEARKKLSKIGFKTKLKKLEITARVLDDIGLCLFRQRKHAERWEVMVENEEVLREIISRIKGRSDEEKDKLAFYIRFLGKTYSLFARSMHAHAKKGDAASQAIARLLRDDRDKFEWVKKRYRLYDIYCSYYVYKKLMEDNEKRFSPTHAKNLDKTCFLAVEDIIGFERMKTILSTLRKKKWKEFFRAAFMATDVRVQKIILAMWLIRADLLGYIGDGMEPIFKEFVTEGLKICQNTIGEEYILAEGEVLRYLREILEDRLLKL
ncbi:MAG: hypothetical protein ABH829_02300 [archaeon]